MRLASFDDPSDSMTEDGDETHLITIEGTTSHRGGEEAESSTKSRLSTDMYTEAH